MPGPACPPASPSAKQIGIHSCRRLKKQPLWLCRRGQTPTTNTIVLGPSGRSFTQNWSSSLHSGQLLWQNKLLWWPFSSWVCYRNGNKIHFKGRSWTFQLVLFYFFFFFSRNLFYMTGTTKLLLEINTLILQYVSGKGSISSCVLWLRRSPSFQKLNGKG